MNGGESQEEKIKPVPLVVNNNKNIVFLLFDIHFQVFPKLIPSQRHCYSVTYLISPLAVTTRAWEGKTTKYKTEEHAGCFVEQKYFHYAESEPPDKVLN